MKKILLSATFVLGLAAYLNAQSFKIYYKNTTTDITGTTIHIDSILNGDIYQKVKCDTLSVKNISGSTLKVRCVRSETFIVTGSENNFCWGSGCYGTSVNVSPLLQSPDMAPGAIDNSFVGDYTPIENEGASTIQYCFYDNANPTDQACITVVYSASATAGIHDLSKTQGSITNAYPNPASSVVSFKYEMNDYSQNGKIRIYDMLGKVVKEIGLNEKEGIVKMNVSELNEGIYFYTFFINDKTVSTKKMVINSK
jgi:hypothetical protein